MGDDFHMEGIRVTGDPLKNLSKKEIPYPKDVLLSSEVFLQMAHDLDEFGGTNLEQEFLLFSTNGTVVDVMMPIGQRLSNRSGAEYKRDRPGFDPNNIYHVIQQNLDKGLHLIGSYHMHPSETGEKMKQNGFAAEDGVGPSVSDIQVPVFIHEDFNIPVLRIIGGIMDGHKTFRAFNFLRIPTDKEITESTFLTGGDWTDDDLLASERCANIHKLAELKIIEEIPIRIQQ